MTKVVDEYEASLVAVGHTLAEIVNLPAKTLTKAIWLHNMMEVTEGPVIQPMKEAFDRIKAETNASNEKYRKGLSEALQAFETALGE